MSRLHRQVNFQLWGVAPDEQLSWLPGFLLWSELSFRLCSSCLGFQLLKLSVYLLPWLFSLWTPVIGILSSDSISQFDKFSPTHEILSLTHMHMYTLLCTYTHNDCHVISLKSRSAFPVNIGNNSSQCCQCVLFLFPHN